jgi:hypothetical protein
MSGEPKDLKRLKEMRDKVIRYVYEHGAGNWKWGVDRDQVKQALGITEHELRNVYMLMIEQHLVPEGGSISDIGLSERGQEEAVRLGTSTAMHEPSPAPITINANYSIVQVAGANSTQSAQLSIDQSKVSHVIDQIEKELPSLNLQPVERAEASDLLTSLRKLITEKLPGAAARAVGAALAAIITAGGSKLGEILLSLLHIGTQ